MTHKDAGQLKPSDFVKRGRPSCSRWGKSEMEWIAYAYVEALEADGDEWKPLTRERCNELLTDKQRERTHRMLSEQQQWRFDAVAKQITDAEGALGVGGFWRMP